MSSIYCDYMNKLTGVILLACLLTVGLGWWDKGHMLISQIAYNHLTDLGATGIRDKFNALITAFNTLTDGRTNTFTEAAVWPDDIKGYKAGQFDNYHFTNIPYDPDFLFKGMSELQQDVNSINIVNWCKSVLTTNIDSVTFERAFMARYLLHVVGDMHQPLHNTMMFNASLPDGDLGGNRINILTPAGKKMNLHSFFDSIALDQDPDVSIIRPLNDSYRAYLEQEARNIMNAYPTDELNKEAEDLDPHHWSVTAYQIAVDTIYPFVKQTDQITPAFQTNSQAILKRQIALGGYRLARYIAALYRQPRT